MLIVNGKVMESEFSESAAAFPAVPEQISVEGCPRKFVVKHTEIEVADIHSLQFLLSGDSISGLSKFCFWAGRNLTFE
jgi:hypothetical protein